MNTRTNLFILNPILNTMSAAKYLIDFLTWLPPWFVVIFIAMVPFVELRGAIPAAVAIYNMPLWEAFVFSVIGNMIPVPIILFYLGDVERFLRRWKTWERFFDRLYARTRSRAMKRIERWEELGVIIFVAIPLPFTGAWTGSLIAYLFDLDFKKSFLCVLAGVLIAGVIVSSLVYFGMRIF